MWSVTCEVEEEREKGMEREEKRERETKKERENVLCKYERSKNCQFIIQEGNGSNGAKRNKRLALELFILGTNSSFLVTCSYS